MSAAALPPGLRLLLTDAAEGESGGPGPPPALMAAMREHAWLVLSPAALRQEWAAAASEQSMPAPPEDGAPRPAGWPQDGGVVLASGGSSGRRRWCLQPFSHLQASARASGRWLADLGLDPSSMVHVNPLPLHHVSGLMPWIRALCWQARCLPLPAALMRDPAALPALPEQCPAVISLVPTQLERLLAREEGRLWLQRFAVIWVGGAALRPDQRARARRAGLALAPCYGATETAAMVCAQSPQAFLAGASGCGRPLADVALRCDPQAGRIEVATARLSPGWVAHGRVRELPRRGRWWRSGDAGRLTSDGLVVRGRLDGAISSGGETVFPEALEMRLRALARDRGWPLAEVLLLPEPDPVWGERVAALLRLRDDARGQALIADLQEAVAGWSAAERPRRWLLCPELAPSASGKWERERWRAWLRRRRGAAAEDAR
jgi:O-succinylbenzoic acid--CoA ligase